MHIKRYTIAALLLMVMTGGFIYTYVTPDTYSLDLFGIPLPSISIALLVIVPVFVLYVASVLHISFYSFVGALNLRKYEKDYEKTIDAIVETYLGKKSRSYSFKTDRYKLLGLLLENTTVFPTGDIIGKTNNAKIDSVLKVIEGIKNGQVVDLKEYNLKSSNELVIQNERNRYKNAEISAELILSNATKYDEVLLREVYVDSAKTATLTSLEKYKSLLTKESLYVILSRVNADEYTLEISNDELISIIGKLDLSKNDYIKLSSVIATGGMIPEQRIKLFELLSDDNEDVMDAYLYTLFDLEMLAPANDILDNSQKGEYENFKAYQSLKECNKNFSIELFV